MKTFLSICSNLGFAAALVVRAENELIFDSYSYHASDIYYRDVAVIGGGSSGTYGAIKLGDMGKSVIVIEKENVLGGHENTYTDPKTGTAIDFGVQAYWNISVVTDFLARFDIPIETFAPTPGTVAHADFETGKYLPNFVASTNITGYADQLAKYPYLLYSWDLPNPIPQDLLLPFGEFVTKYGLQSEVFTIYSESAGVGNILDQLTVNVFKIFDQAFLDSLQGGDVTTSNHNNGELYVKALAELGDNALLSSTVIASERPSSGSNVTLVVNTPTGNKLIIASQLLITIPPLSSTLAPFDLDAAENALFSQWTYSAYYNGIINNTGLTAGTRYVNVGADTTYNIPNLPGAYSISPSAIEGYYVFWFGNDTPLSESQVEAAITTTVQLLTNNKSQKPELVAFSSHTPFKLVVSADDISNGFYNNLKGLQGQRNTWWSGAAFLSHSSGELWNFTQSLLPDIVSAVGK